MGIMVPIVAEEYSLERFLALLRHASHIPETIAKGGCVPLHSGFIESFQLFGLFCE
jgi:hypothetical protein